MDRTKAKKQTLDTQVLGMSLAEHVAAHVAAAIGAPKANRSSVKGASFKAQLKETVRETQAAATKTEGEAPRRKKESLPKQQDESASISGKETVPEEVEVTGGLPMNQESGAEAVEAAGQGPGEVQLSDEEKLAHVRRLLAKAEVAKKVFETPTPQQLAKYVHLKKQERRLLKRLNPPQQQHQPIAPETSSSLESSPALAKHSDPPPEAPQHLLTPANQAFLLPSQSPSAVKSPVGSSSSNTKTPSNLRPDPDAKLEQAQTHPLPVAGLNLPKGSVADPALVIHPESHLPTAEVQAAPPMQDTKLSPITPDRLPGDASAKHSPQETQQNGTRSIPLASLGIADDPRAISTLSLSQMLGIDNASELGVNNATQPRSSQVLREEERASAAPASSHENLATRKSSVRDPQTSLAASIELKPRLGVGEAFLDPSSGLEEEHVPADGADEQADSIAGVEDKSGQSLKNEELVQSNGAEESREISKKDLGTESNDREGGSTGDEGSESSISMGEENTEVASMDIESREVEAENGQDQKETDSAAGKGAAMDVKNEKESDENAPEEADEDVPLKYLRRPPVQGLQQISPAKTELEGKTEGLESPLSRPTQDREQKAVLGSKISAEHGQVPHSTYGLTSTTEGVNLNGKWSEEGSPTSEKENQDASNRPNFGGSRDAEGPVSKEGGLSGGKSSGERKTLAQCDECGKLRIFVKEGLIMREEFNGGDWWTCEMAGLSCDAPEDPEVDSFNTLKKEEKLVAQAAANGKSPAKKSENGSLKVKLKLKATPSPPAKFKKVGVSGTAERKSKEKAKSKLAGSKDDSKGGEDNAARTQAEPETERSGGTLFVPEGFTLIFTARHTEKSVAMNALGDLRYSFPADCRKPVGANGKFLSYIQSYKKLEEFLAENHEHPKVQGLSKDDFILSSVKFEPMLLEAYGEGANKDKRTFTNKGGIITATRAGQEVPAVPFRFIPSPAGKQLRASLGGAIKSSKKVLGSDGKKLHLKGQLSKLKRLFVDEQKEGSSSPKRLKFGDKKAVISEERETKGEKKRARVELEKEQIAKPKKEKVPDKVTGYALEDSEDRMHSPDRLNLVGEDVEGKLKKLSLYYVAEDGAAKGLRVWRWKLTADPLGIAVKTKNANEWISLDLDRAEVAYAPVLAPLKRRVELLRPFLAAEAITWEDVRSAVAESPDPAGDLLFIRTWVRRLRPEMDEKVAQAIQGYTDWRTEEAERERDASPATDDEANQVTALDEEIAQKFLENEEDIVILGDSVCAICDDGGNDPIVCEGECMRMFHARVKDGQESSCATLKMSDKEYESFVKNTDVPWLCLNCTTFQHQCYICGHLGDSDKESAQREVFKCEIPGCGHFYHPLCLARYEVSSGTAKDLEEREKEIREELGYFACPLHTCDVCKEPEENMTQTDGALVKCRRCPVAYHVKCLPKDLPTNNKRDAQRAWGPGVEKEQQIDQRLCYCPKHPIDPDLGTAKRDHLKLKPRTRGAVPLKIKASTPKESPQAGPSQTLDFKAETPKLSDTKAEPSPKLLKRLKKVSDSVASAEEADDVSKSLDDVIRKGKAKVVEESTEQDLLIAEEYGVPGEEIDDVEMEVVTATEAEEGPATLPQTQLAMAEDEVGEIPLEGLENPEPKEVSLGDDFEAVLKDIQRRAEGEVTLQSVQGELVRPFIYSSNSSDTRSRIWQKSRLEPIANTIEKGRAAVLRGDFTAATRICNPIAYEIEEFKRLESVLRCYIAPFLHGSRYTSFGRHFTQPGKLRDIVERLHPYIDDGDCIVDFCCGANDFSVILAQRLNESGKTNCQYFNFDLITARNDFNFTKKDWFHVGRQDLNVDGRRLIMGLNPPFGVNAALANKFIEHALTWEPKMLILIVPPETRKLDDQGYRLCWEDHQVVSGRSFYLPGSINKQDWENLDQWNKIPPPLYLWSHHAFFDKHMQIASTLGHQSIYDFQQGSWEERDQAFQMHQQHMQPQWGPYPGVLQAPPPFHPGANYAPPPPPAEHFLPPPPPLPVGATPIEMQMLADQARTAAQAQVEQQMQEFKRQLDVLMAEDTTVKASNKAWREKFGMLKTENERLKAAEEDLQQKIPRLEERSLQLQYLGQTNAQLQCKTERDAAEKELQDVVRRLNNSEAEGEKVFKIITASDARMAELGQAVPHFQSEMESLLRQQQAMLAGLQQQQQQLNGGYSHALQEAGYPGVNGYGPDRPNREEHRKQRREDRAPYGDRGQRPSSQNRPADRGGHRSWGERGPIERGEALLPAIGQWETGHFGQAPPPPPAFRPPGAEFLSFNGPARY